MAKGKKHKKPKHKQDPQGIVINKKESSSPNSRQGEIYPGDNEQNESDLQKQALLSALNIETRKHYGEEPFDEDAANGEEEDDDDDDD